MWVTGALARLLQNAEGWAAGAFKGGLELGTCLHTLLRGWGFHIKPAKGEEIQDFRNDARDS